MSKAFHISDIISITDGRLVSTRGIGGVYDILNYMTGDDIFTHQLGRVGQEVKPYILQQHPCLSDIAMQSALDNLTVRLHDIAREDAKHEIEQWLNIEVIPITGEWLDCTPIPVDESTPSDPIIELVDMVGNKPIIIAQI
jgi:hypothetical protein